MECGEARVVSSIAVLGLELGLRSTLRRDEEAVLTALSPGCTATGRRRREGEDGDVRPEEASADLLAEFETLAISIFVDCSWTTTCFTSLSWGDC